MVMGDNPQVEPGNANGVGIQPPLGPNTTAIDDDMQVDDGHVRITAFPFELHLMLHRFSRQQSQRGQGNKMYDANFVGPPAVPSLTFSYVETQIELRWVNYIWHEWS